MLYKYIHTNKQRQIEEPRRNERVLVLLLHTPHDHSPGFLRFDPPSSFLVDLGLLVPSSFDGTDGRSGGYGRRQDRCNVDLEGAAGLLNVVLFIGTNC